MRLRWIRRGITREVFLVGRWALKIPTWRYGWEVFLRGLQANISEATWTNYADGAPCNPVVRKVPGGWLNVYRRAEPYTGDIDDVRWEPYGDRKLDNVGVVDGRVVLIDYDMNNGPCRTCLEAP